MLTDFEKVDDPTDWVPGVHGVELEARVNGRNYSSTFLPEVMEEQGWDVRTTLNELLYKAGLYVNLDDVMPHLKVTRYQSKKYKMSYAEYQQFK